MEQPILLSSAQQIPAKSFADPHHTLTEHGIMYRLLNDVQQLARAATMRTEPATRMVAFVPDLTAWQQRFILLRPMELLHSDSVFVVGFFGQKNLAIDYRLHMQLAQMDEQFLDNLDSHPYLLAYCTIMLPDGINFANIVLFSREEGIAMWGRRELHSRVVRELAPVCYESIRLYNGRWQPATQMLTLLHVKYFDYQSQPNWRAIRPIIPQS